MLKGFICPRDGKNKKYVHCWTVCADHCMPLPALLALSKQMRGTEKDVYHVTEILNPPQIVWLARNKDYYVPPDSLIDMNIGTSWHEKIEQTKKYIRELGLQKEYIMEKNFKVPFWCYPKENQFATVVLESDIDNIWRNGGYKKTILSGTPDLYVKSINTIWDYKVMKYYYTLKYLRDNKWEDNTYAWQLNIYRRFTHPDAKMRLFCYIKDWKRNFPERFGVNRTEIVEVPRIPDRVVDNKVKALLAEHVENQRDPSNIRQCTEKERWMNFSEPVRCEGYCGVQKICPQYGG